MGPSLPLCNFWLDYSTVLAEMFYDYKNVDVYDIHEKQDLNIVNAVGLTIRAPTVKNIKIVFYRYVFSNTQVISLNCSWCSDVAVWGFIHYKRIAFSKIEPAKFA